MKYLKTYKMLNEAFEVQEEFNLIVKHLLENPIKNNIVFFIKDLVPINEFKILKSFIQAGIAFIVNDKIKLRDPCAFISPNEYNVIKNGGYWGKYDNPDITIEKCPIGIIEVNKFSSIDNHSTIFGHSKETTAMVHELRHAYNFYISGGKNMKNYNYSASSKEELGAVISGLINEIDWYNDNGKIIPFKEILNIFTKSQGLNNIWKTLSKEKKKRVIRKIYQAWEHKKK